MGWGFIAGVFVGNFAYHALKGDVVKGLFIGTVAAGLCAALSVFL